jgi:hypothetical protein
MTPGFNLTPLSSFGLRLPLKMRYLFAKRLVPKVPPDSSMRSSPCLIRALIDRFTVLSLAASHSIKGGHQPSRQTVLIEKDFSSYPTQQIAEWGFLF